MQMLVTRLDGSEYFAKSLKGFPSQRRLWNQLAGGLITNATDPWGSGNWYDRAGYFGYPLVGHTMQVVAHMLASKLDLHLPLLETAFNRSLNGLLRPHKYPYEYSHTYYPSVLLVNPRFPALAPQSIRNLNDSKFQAAHNITGEAAELGKNLYLAGKQTGLEPCDGVDFGALGSGAPECITLNKLYVSGTLLCHRCRIVTDHCTVAPLSHPVAGGIN
jgi:hypothetical protein